MTSVGPAAMMRRSRYDHPPPPPHPPHTHVNASFTNYTAIYNSYFDSSSWFPWYYHTESHRRITSSSNPIAFQLLNYVQFLGWMLMAWIIYLLVPKGVRKAYCRADRRRHKRYRQVALLPDQKRALTTAAAMRPSSPPLNISVPRIHLESSSSKSDEDRKHQLFQSEPRLHEPQLDERRHSLVSLLDEPKYFLSSKGASPVFQYHPTITIAPSQKILRDTFSRLEHAGIRLLAHGIQCESKRVWIKIVFDTLNNSYSLRWQTEVCQTLTSMDGRVSQVWVKRGGAGHTLPLKNVLCVDVGKNTSALARKTDLDPNTCFSLLTPTGSLDLQARSQLERDAVVCCFALLLDEVHDVDWRHLYQESPEPSTVTSALPSTSSNAAMYAESSVDSNFF